VSAFEDNYIWLVQGHTPDRVAVVDPGDETPVLRRLEQGGLQPVAILCTHHHWDHTGGIQALRDRYHIPVYAPAREHIPSATHRVAGGDRVDLESLDLCFDVIETPGHTRGHIAYAGAGMLFCGDTLFSAGCGRLFEGSAEQLYASLERLAALPDDTLVYCAHEYTAANLRFAAAVEPGNPAIRTRTEEVERLRSRGQPSLPAVLGGEKRYNPFLRSTVPAVRQAAERHAGKPLDSPLAVFTELRRWKDGFR
jgi:hydroxyacylglutathione hydrolase